MNWKKPELTELDFEKEQKFSLRRLFHTKSRTHDWHGHFMEANVAGVKFYPLVQITVRWRIRRYKTTLNHTSFYHRTYLSNGSTSASTNSPHWTAAVHCRNSFFVPGFTKLYDVQDNILQNLLSGNLRRFSGKIRGVNSRRILIRTNSSNTK
jgi:hypothetical protein